MVVKFYSPFLSSTRYSIIHYGKHMHSRTHSRVHAHTHAYMHTHTHTHTHTHAHARMHARTHATMHARAHDHTKMHSIYTMCTPHYVNHTKDSPSHDHSTPYIGYYHASPIISHTFTSDCQALPLPNKITPTGAHQPGIQY